MAKEDDGILRIPDKKKAKLNKKEPKRKKLKISTEKYDRGGGLKKKERSSASNKKLNASLKAQHRFDQEAANRLARNEVLLPDEGGFLEAEGLEKTWKIRQKTIAAEVDIGTAQKKFAFDLPFGPYACSFSRNGRSLVIGGKRGHLAMFNLQTMKPMCEFNVKQDVRAVQTLHNELMFAASQKKYTYIYDQKGIEIHCMKDHRFVNALDFLPYHYLLVSGNDFGDLRYHDVSIGKLVASHKTEQGAIHAMKQNRQNAVMHLGSGKGVVSLWTPNVKEPVLSMFCHKGAITALDVYRDYMVTAGADGHWKVWDMRMNERLHTFSYFGTSPDSVDVSMTGLVGLGFGCHTQVWKDVFTTTKPKMPYLAENFQRRQVSSFRFRPYEDLCVVGHSGGIASMIIPGAGLANYDSYEANPYETKKERREKEVHSLLEKLQPEMITLDGDRIGAVAKKWEPKPAEVLAQETKEHVGLKASELKKEKKKRRMRGKDKVGKRVMRKEKARADMVRDAMKERPAEPLAAQKEAPAVTSAGALQRFFDKKKK